jgi:hypothetical protein
MGVPPKQPWLAVVRLAMPVKADPCLPFCAAAPLFMAAWVNVSLLHAFSCLLQHSGLVLLGCTHPGSGLWHVLGCWCKLASTSLWECRPPGGEARLGEEPWLAFMWLTYVQVDDSAWHQ